MTKKKSKTIATLSDASSASVAPADPRERIVTVATSFRQTAPSAAATGLSLRFASLPWKDQLQIAREVLNRRVDDLRREYPELIGLGVGHKIANDEAAMRVAIRFGVSAKSDRPSRMLPPDLDGVPTDVYTSRFVPAVNLAGGDAIAPQSDSSHRGTMTVVVFDPRDPNVTDPRPILLTCAHVVSALGNLDAGPVTMINNSGDVVGASVPNSASDVNWVLDEFADAALIDPAVGMTVSTKVIGSQANDKTTSIGAVSDDDFSVGANVWMVGEKSGYKTGFMLQSGPFEAVDGLPVSNHFHVMAHNGGKFGQLGDSGAAIIRGQEIIGMLRAVNESTGEALCFPLLDLARRMNFRLL